MAIKNIDFDDLPEEDFDEKEKKVSLTVKITEEAREMFAKIAKRERRNMLQHGSVVIQQYIEKYIADYEKSREGEESDKPA